MVAAKPRITCTLYSTLALNLPLYDSYCACTFFQMIGLSQERFNFGNVPLFAVIRRLVFLKNQTQYSVSYHWELSGHLLEKVKAYTHCTCNTCITCTCMCVNVRSQVF